MRFSSICVCVPVSNSSLSFIQYLFSEHTQYLYAFPGSAVEVAPILIPRQHPLCDPGWVVESYPQRFIRFVSMDTILGGGICLTPPLHGFPHDLLAGVMAVGLLYTGRGKFYVHTP